MDDLQTNGVAGRVSLVNPLLLVAMETTVQSSPAGPRRRAAKPASSTTLSKPRKLPEVAVEATAEAFMAAFQALPSAVRWRIVQKIEDYEDELDAQELAAAKLANPADFDRANAITLEAYMSQRRARSTKSGNADSLAA